MQSPVRGIQRAAVDAQIPRTRTIIDLVIVVAIPAVSKWHLYIAVRGCY